MMEVRNKELRKAVAFKLSKKASIGLALKFLGPTAFALGGYGLLKSRSKVRDLSAQIQELKRQGAQRNPFTTFRPMQ